MADPGVDASTDPSAVDVAPDKDLDFACSVALDSFSGPLDLLLFLVRRAEVDIVDIPIAEIADQYIATVSAWADLDLEQAGEFILMAASLLEIKARLIAPPPEEPQETDGEEDEAIDLRAELVAKLLAYRRFKEAAFDLNVREAEHLQRLTRQLREDIPEDPEEAEGIDLENADPYLLCATWQLVNKRISGLGPRTVVGDPVPLEAVFADLIATMRDRGTERLSRLFANHPTKVGRVTTLMAVLECARQRFVEAIQHGQYADVDLRFRPDDERPVRVIEFAAEPPPPRRQKRPPLTTWQPAPGAEVGATAEDEVETPEAPSETDEQRFLRELEETCAVEAVLERGADLETGFARYWAEKRGEPWPPPKPVSPPTPEPAPAAVQPPVSQPAAPAKPRGRPFQKKSAVAPAPEVAPAVSVPPVVKPAAQTLLLMYQPPVETPRVEAPVVAEQAAPVAAPTSEPVPVAAIGETQAPITEEPAEVAVPAAVEPAPAAPEVPSVQPAAAVEPIVVAEPVVVEPTPSTTRAPVIEPVVIAAVEPAPEPVAALVVEEPAASIADAPTTDPPAAVPANDPWVEPTPVTTAAIVETPAEPEPEPIVEAAPVAEVVPRSERIVPTVVEEAPTREPEPALTLAAASPPVPPPSQTPRAPLAAREPTPLPVVSPAKARTRQTTLDRPFRPRVSARRTHALALSATLVLVAAGCWWAFHETGERHESASPSLVTATQPVAPPRIEAAGPAMIPQPSLPAPMASPSLALLGERLLAARVCVDPADWLAVIDGDATRVPAAVDPTMGMTFGPIPETPAAAVVVEAEPVPLQLPPPPRAPAPGIALWLDRLVAADDVATWSARLGEGVPSIPVIVAPAPAPALPAPAAETAPERAFAWQSEPMMSPSAWLVLWAWGDAPIPTP